jgi:hypothetical protein
MVVSYGKVRRRENFGGVLLLFLDKVFQMFSNLTLGKFQAHRKVEEYKVILSITRFTIFYIYIYYILKHVFMFKYFKNIFMHFFV